MAYACVATAPTPALAQATPLPTKGNLDCTATPQSWAFGSQATMEKVVKYGLNFELTGLVGVSDTDNRGAQNMNKCISIDPPFGQIIWLVGTLFNSFLIA